MALSDVSLSRGSNSKSVIWSIKKKIWESLLPYVWALSEKKKYIYIHTHICIHFYGCVYVYKNKCTYSHIYIIRVNYPSGKELLLY